MEEGKDQESFQSKTHLFKETRYWRNINGLGVSSVESVVESYILVIQHTFKARGTATHRKQAGTATDEGFGVQKKLYQYNIASCLPKSIDRRTVQFYDCYRVLYSIISHHLTSLGSNSSVNFDIYRRGHF